MQLHRGLSLKNSYSSILLCYPEILYHFQSTICHPHIILEMLQTPTHFLVNTGFFKILSKTIYFDHTIKTFIPTPRCLHTLFAPLGSTKPSGYIIYNSSSRNPFRNAFLTSI